MRKGGNKTKKGRKRKADEANLAEVDDEEVEAEVARQQAGAGAGGLEWVSSLLFTLLSPAILITLHNLATANCEL